MNKLAALLVGGLLTLSFPAQASILWSHSGAILVCQNGKGEDILHGAIRPQDSNSTSTLYFRFKVDTIADSVTKSIADFEAGFVFVEKGQEHVGMGNALGAWAYCAMNVPKTKKGYVDFNSATPDPGYRWEYIRAGSPKYIAFRVDYVPGQDARITAWLNPDLSLGTTEFNQPTNIVTRFEAAATFDEIHLVHRGINGGGWKFSQMVAGTSFEDLLIPHFWQRGWFLSVAGAGLLVLVGGMVHLFERRRAQRQIRWLERERAVAAERARIARDIHDDLGASLTKICKLAELMDRPPGNETDPGTLSQTIAATARNTIQTMDEIVWAVNPKNDTLKEMADYLVYFTEEFLRPSKIACRLDVPLKLPDISVTADMRHNLFMVVKEALNNAVKHSAAAQIRFSLFFTDDQLVIEIADNGRGFEPDKTPVAGDGLENMRKRMTSVGGELQLETAPGQGTRIKLEASLREK